MSKNERVRVGGYFAVFFLFFFFNFSKADTQELYPFTQTTDHQRFYYITKEVRCVVCQNQSISESNAPLANDLRQKIYQMILQKKSNEEIKDYLLKRYGEFILFKPAFNKFTIILWIFPFLGLAMILISFIKINEKSN